LNQVSDGTPQIISPITFATAAQMTQFSDKEKQHPRLTFSQGFTNP